MSEGDWVCEAQLGTGGFGIVNVWRNRKSNQRVALKKCKFGSEEMMTARHKTHWAQEVNIMLKLDHPNVVKCFPVPPGLDEGSQDLPSLCMEYCESGDLRRLLNQPQNCRGLTSTQSLSILSNVAAALQYLHNKRIIHRDLKPENVVLKGSDSSVTYKLIDLGYAKELGASSLAKSFVGTLQYVAPELFLEKDYTKSVDYWSLGLICYEIVTGQRPFLPHFSPGKWVDHVQGKEREHIAVVESLEGNIENKEKICAETRISRPLAQRLENWLQCLVEWNPVTRGKDGSGNIIVYEQLQTIIRQKEIKIFNMSSRSVFTFCDQLNNLTFTNLQQAVSTQLGIGENYQLFLTQHGYRLSCEDQLVQLVNSEVSIFLIDERRINTSLTEQLQQVSFYIPHLVQSCLRDVKLELMDYHHKLVYIHSYHLLADESIKYNLFAQGLRSLTGYLTNQTDQIDISPLNNNFIKVKSKLDFHNISLDQDLNRYQQQASSRDRITSNRMIQNWKQSGVDLVKSVDTIHSRMAILEESVRSYTSAIKNIKSESQEVPSTDKILQECETRSLQLYDSLRRQRPSTRTDNTARNMAHLIVRMLRRRDELLNDSCGRLVKLRQLLLDGIDMKVGRMAVMKACEKVEGSITRSQARRQSDIWTLVSVAIKYIPQQASEDNEGRNNLDKDNDNTINVDTTNTDRILQENEDLRKEMESRMKSLEDVFKGSNI